MFDASGGTVRFEDTVWMPLRRKILRSSTNLQNFRRTLSYWRSKRFHSS